MPEPTFEELRRMIHTTFTGAAPLPAGTRTATAELDGVPVLWIDPPPGSPASPASAAPDRVLFYLHGGGYCLGSTASHAGFVARLARAAAARAVAVEYRTAPEHRFPAALDDAVSAYRALLASGVAPSSVCFAGDSAGGGLCIATLVQLRELSVPLPAAAVLMSPWTDLAARGASIRDRAHLDRLVTPAVVDRFAAAYLGDADRTHPLASPVDADLAGLPPLLIQVGTNEILYDDATRLAARARAAAVPVTCREFSGMGHVFQLECDKLRSARTAVEEIGAFVRAAC